MTEAEAVQRYVQSQLDYAISNTPPEKMAQVTEDMINQFKVAATQRGEAMAHAILRDKEALYKGHRAGRFHPDNRDSRRMFTDLTGIELPKTQKGTDPIIEVCNPTRGKGNRAKRRMKALADARAECKWCGSPTGKASRPFCDTSCAHSYNGGY